jgi:hypothetical protein
MFQFPPLASFGLCIQPRMTTHDGRRVSPFGHHRIKSLRAAPRCLSQLTTPFIACPCLGIPRAPLYA